jgi:hypothetical protein
MRYYLIIVSIFLFSQSVLAQTNEAILSRLLFKDSLIGKLVVEDCMKGHVFYYLDGEKIDMNRTFFNTQNITVTILKPKQARQILGDTSSSAIVYIDSNPKIELVSLFSKLKNRGIDSTQTISMQLAIDNVKILDPNVLIDSKIQINLLYKGFPEHKESTPIKKEDFMGVIIFTNQIEKS